MCPMTATRHSAQPGQEGRHASTSRRTGVTTTQDAAGKADIARSHGQQAAEDAKGRAAEVTQHAQGAAHDVAGTAAEQAQNVKQETVRQARNLVSEAGSQLSSQAGSQTQKVTENLRSLADELRQM